MRTLVFALAATIAVGALWTVGAQAKDDFLFEGHKHCWYEKGWHGAGWYWCGYATREGKGWGGPEGYQGWRH